MLPSVYLDLPEQEAAKEFASTRNRALLRRIWAFLRRQLISNRLLSFDEVMEGLSPWLHAYLGSWTVPVESIIGSEGRYEDFDDEFLPLQGSSEEQWRSFYEALRRHEELPPVSLLKVGDTYFVRDGNYRVSVARWLGVEALDAEVAEVRAEVPIEAAIFALIACAVTVVLTMVTMGYTRETARRVDNDPGYLINECITLDQEFTPETCPAGKTNTRGLEQWMAK